MRAIKIRTLIVYDRHKNATAEKEGAVSVRVSIGRKNAYIPTGVYCLPNEWNDAAKAVVGRRPDKARLNYLIAETLTRKTNTCT